LQCVLAARILTVDFVVCTIAVKKKIRARFHLSDRTIPLSDHQESVILSNRMLEASPRTRRNIGRGSFSRKSLMCELL
jgi:hypothetical protein